MTKEKKPDCFGVLYDVTACAECGLADDCKVAFEKKDAEMVVAAALKEEEEAEAAVAASLTEGAETPADVAPAATPAPATTDAPAAPAADSAPAAPATTDAPPAAKAKTKKKAGKKKAADKPAPAIKKKTTKPETATKKKADKPAETQKDAATTIELENRPTFKELMAAGKIVPVVEGKKTYMQVDGKHVYKSQIYHEKNLKELAEKGTNPFKAGSLPAEAFDYLMKGSEVTFRDTFEHLKKLHPDMNDATLMNRAADVLSGAHFFGIAKVTRKEGRQRYFQKQ